MSTETIRPVARSYVQEALIRYLSMRKIPSLRNRCAAAGVLAAVLFSGAAFAAPTANGPGPSAEVELKQKLQAAIESVRLWHDRMKHVNVLNRDGFELLAKVPDDPQTVVYCDPPYVVKSGRYRIDFAVGDHERLAQALARFRKTRVVVSYYDHPLLDQLYAGWHKRILNEWKTRPHNGVRKPKPPEILLINGPSLVPPASTVASRRAGQSLAV